jgi:hypothetical protein
MEKNIKGSQWSRSDKKRLKEIMSNSDNSSNKNLLIASEELSRTRNACAWQWYMFSTKGKKLYKKIRSKQKVTKAKVIMEKVNATPTIKEAKRLPIVSIMRNGELLKVNCIGGTNGTTIYKADNLIIIVDTNN